MTSTTNPINKKRKFEKINMMIGKAKKIKLQTENISLINKIPIKHISKDADNICNKLKVILSPEEIDQKYPILNDHELTKKFLAVPMTNNQKGRIRQMYRDHLKGTENPLPDVIYGKIQSLIKSPKELTEPELRKIRILFNMLKTSLQNGVENKTTKNDKSSKQNNDADPSNLEKQSPENSINKIKHGVKGPKRYVVFVGNLPVDIGKEKVLQHFSDLSDSIIDVRIPKKEGAIKSCIAYVELKDEHSYEMALSKHHSMLDNKRINVLYSTQKNSKISIGAAKSTSAKLVALQKSGKLIGSIPLNRKRSHRRNKAKRALAKLQQS